MADLPTVLSLPTEELAPEVMGAPLAPVEAAMYAPHKSAAVHD